MDKNIQEIYNMYTRYNLDLINRLVDWLLNNYSKLSNMINPYSINSLFCTKFSIVTSNPHSDNCQKVYMGKIHYLDFKARVQFIIPTIIELSRGGVRAPLCSARNEPRWKSQMSLAISALCGRLMLLNGCVNI